MSIRKTQKSRAKNTELKLVTKSRPEAPISKHPLIFWTQHHGYPVEVDLREFADGKPASRNRNANRRYFTGRPNLIDQLRPILEAELAFSAPRTVIGSMTILRRWWVLLDTVEALTEAVGNPIERVDDVRQLMMLHREVAQREKMERNVFSRFRRWADLARRTLGAKPTNWHGLEGSEIEKYIPPLEQREDVRQAVKRECLRVIDQWDLFDRLRQLPHEPAEPEATSLWRGLCHLHDTQQRTGYLVPTIDALNGLDVGRHRMWCTHHTGIRPTAILQTAFASRRDALAIFSQCMVTTGWNVTVMLTLDANTEFLRNHPKDDPLDPNIRWVLTGIKERARGAEQMTVGPWKASYLAGSLIKRYMQRTQPLREVLNAQLVEARIRYEAARQEEPEAPNTKKLFREIAVLRRAQRSIWLYVDVEGRIKALNDFLLTSHFDGKGNRTRLTYMDALVADLNNKRKLRGKSEVPGVTYSDFRLWFAEYLHRSSLGNMLVVMLGLGHKSQGTTKRYVNTNLANRDAENKSLEFQEILTQELSLGRVDVTILAFKVRHGEFNQEMEDKLVQLRRLPKSRQGVGCRDPLKPPPHLKATPGLHCDSQRCLLCKQHAVLLPESLDGIAMREAELKVMQEGLPLTTFIGGDYQVELENHELALRLFDPAEVVAARAKWAESIRTGLHIVPGLLTIGQESLP